MDFKEIGCDDVDWIHQAQYRVWWLAVVNAVMNPCGFIEGREFLD
jgi:hypothetical protein